MKISWHSLLCFTSLFIFFLLYIRQQEKKSFLFFCKRKDLKDIDKRIKERENDFLEKEKEFFLREKDLKSKESELSIKTKDYWYKKNQLNLQNSNLENEKKIFDRELKDFEEKISQEKNNRLTKIEADYEKRLLELKVQEENSLKEIKDLQETFLSLVEPLKKIEKETESNKYYCIPVSEDIKKDISFLTEKVLPRLTHPDVLRKLIWTEYFQQPLNVLLKKLNIDEQPGIYKITNILNKKSYIGKSTNVKKRLQEHVKGALQISSIADQKIHKAMAEEGIWNFAFERICTCPKEELSRKEKYYISFFDSTQDYNITNGG